MIASLRVAIADFLRWIAAYLFDPQEEVRCEQCRCIIPVFDAFCDTEGCDFCSSCYTDLLEEANDAQTSA